MPIANYTTKVSAHDSVGAIQGMLAKHGARASTIDYEDGLPVRIIFSINVNGADVWFKLDANPDGVLAVLNRQRVEPRYRTVPHALNVGWRIQADWLRAHLAIVESGVMPLLQAMLPYALTPSGRTLYEHITSDEGMRALGAGS